jgi:uncharacterized SAM-binding protein YcdF (DUF218 family)
MSKAMKHMSFLFCAFFALFLSRCNAYYNRFYADPDQCFELAKRNKPYDAIIVPGYPYDPRSANGIIEERLRWAHYLFQNGYAKNIILSGSAVHSPYVEAEVMRLLAIQLGIPASHLFTETKAEHTTENLYYSHLLAQKLGFKSVAFATQPAQASYMKAFNRKWDLQIEMLPVVTSCINPSDVRFQLIDTSATKIPDFIPLKERENFITSLRGTSGHRVKVERRKSGVK